MPFPSPLLVAVALAVAVAVAVAVAGTVAVAVVVAAAVAVAVPVAVTAAVSVVLPVAVTAAVSVHFGITLQIIRGGPLSAHLICCALVRTYVYIYAHSYIYTGVTNTFSAHMWAAAYPRSLNLTAAPASPRPHGTDIYITYDSGGWVGVYPIIIHGSLKA